MEVNNQRKVRAACDVCHGMKMKCSGGDPCIGCAKSKQVCLYSEPNRLGRPKGSKNRKTQQWNQRRGSIGEAERSRTNSVNRERVFDDNMPAERIARSAGEIISSTEDMLAEFLNENNLPNSSEGGFLPMPEKSWDEAGLLFDKLGSDIGFRYDDFTTPVMPTSYENDLCRTMPGVDLSFLETGSGGSQDPASTLTEDVRLPLFSGENHDKDPNYCSCLDHQTKFLCELKKTECKRSETAVPLLLQATQDSQALWERLSNCFPCQRDQDSVAVLILAMGLRSILQGLQSLLSRQRSSPGSSSAWSGSSSGGSLLFDQAGVESINRRLHHPAANTIRVGSFQIPHDEQAFLTHVLIARTFSKLKRIYDYMVDYVKRVHESHFVAIGTSDKRPVHFVLEDLQRLVMATEDSLRTIIRR
ncbi:hypothetical protein N7465_005119 [Penicillium sp. CMV-2018d]|nr:hypothetical protein N7465_005119 [Penicillium sp. CMV-2018d]